MDEIIWRTEKRKIKDLKPYEFNPREITKENLEKLKQNIEKVGYNAPILVDTDNTIIAGHSRWYALKQLKKKEEDVRVPSRKLTESEFKEINIKDNINLGDWDVSILSEHFSDCPLDEWDMEKEILEKLGQKLEPSRGLIDDDDVPEITDELEVTIKRGEVYLLGNHRLMCGDSANKEDAEKLMNGEKADVVFTSPPYNGNTHIWSKKHGDNKLYKNNKHDDKKSGDYLEFLCSVLNNAFIVTNGFIFWNVGYNANSRFEFIKAIVPHLESLWETVVWKKSSAMNLTSGLTRSFEFIFCFKVGDRRAHLGKKNERHDAFWEIGNNNANMKGEHHACFPVALPEQGIILASEEGENVLDLFGGTGTTLIAAEKLGRKCYMMELEPRYCHVIINRWEKFTGNKAVKEK